MCSFNFNIASLAEKPCKDHLHLNDLNLHHHCECSSVLLLGTCAILGNISVILLHFCSGVLTFWLSLPKYERVVVRDPEEKCSQGTPADQKQQKGQPEPFLTVLSPQVLGRIMGKAYCSIPVLRVWIVHLFCQLFLKYWVLLRVAFCGIQISPVGVVSCLYNISGLCLPLYLLTSWHATICQRM